jgi:hypothetical protein
MIEYQVYDIAILPVIIGLVSLCIKMGLPKKLSPLIAVILGITAGIVYIAPDNIQQAILAGVTIGLSASGLYSGAKNVLK